MSFTHSFHIPVMGIGYSIDTPLKVSQFGIDSVISLVDDILIEKLRKFYCEKFAVPYTEISESLEDFRAKRITSYLDMINDLAKEKFEAIKNCSAEISKELQDYYDMLPEYAEIKRDFLNLFNFKDFVKQFQKNIKMGSIDVNIMTKADRVNYKNSEKLSFEYNDAHAAFRGFANSKLNSSIVLSSGMNPSLYNYIPTFEDFFPDSDGNFAKKIILKVSDFRSAMIQGKFLAKKGIWISEFRIESGLNCGGHAFPTEGYLLGPILEEFKLKISDLKEEMQTIYQIALTNMLKTVPQSEMQIKISAQGGVGTNEEHEFLLNEYNLDSVGWGSPFLLVPEVVNVDEDTLSKLSNAKEDDLYLSNISPLGVQFNSLRGNTKDDEKNLLIKKNKPGSNCPKRFVELNYDFGEKALCTASRKYQYLKIKELQNLNLDEELYDKEYNKIVEKSCICVGLGTSALIVNGLDTKTEGPGVSICPGPNMAYFNKVSTLKEMVDHIYGRSNLIEHPDRPNIFVKELNLYLDYLKNKIEETKLSITNQQIKYYAKFADNLNQGISYYQNLFSEIKHAFTDSKDKIINDLQESSKRLDKIKNEIVNLS